ncbi:MAG: SpaA isopeptide-forming pilin-related protein, partial [Lacrimispora sphenoides]
GDYKIEELDAEGYETVAPFYVRIDVNGTVSLLNGEGRSELTLSSSEQNQINLIVKNVVKTGSLDLEKLDGETRKAITGAQFELSGTSLIDGAFAAYQNHVTGLGVSHVSTGTENGRLYIRFQVDGTENSMRGILTQIPYGSYTLKEIKAPEGYLFSSGSEWVKDFTIESAEGVNLTGSNGIVNTPHELNIEKRDQMTEEILPGAVFVLMTTDGMYVALDENNSYTGLKESQAEGSAFTTGSDGRVTVKRLPAGNYVLKEIEAPANYGVTADKEITVLRSGNTETVMVYDVRNMAKIRINKAASHNHEMRLDGAGFEIYSDKDLTALAGTMTTGNGGIGESEMLLLGTYYVKEQKAPAGYELSDRVYEVTLGSEKEAYTVQADGNDFVTDDYGTGSLVFDKIDSLTGKALAYARFSL